MTRRRDHREKTPWSPMNRGEQRYLEPDGVDRYRVRTPFVFPDGDHPVIVLKKSHGRWLLSDEGHTYMHFGVAATQEVLAPIEDHDGELVLPLPVGNLPFHANFVFAFLIFTRGLLKIAKNALAKS